MTPGLMSPNRTHPAPAPSNRVWHYPADPRSVGAARRDVAAQLRRWDLEELVDAALVVASELATNAALAGRSPARNDAQQAGIALRLTYSHQDVVVEVWDGAADRPVRRKEDLTADNGRGLQLVAALARDWGYYRVRVGGIPHGKVVWAALPHHTPPIRLLTHEVSASPDLPRRSPSIPPTENAPDPDVPDLELLQRVIDGLRALDGWTRPPSSQPNTPLPSI